MNNTNQIKQAILNEIYDKIGRPDGVIDKERVHFYEGWNDFDIQRGLVSIFYIKKDIDGYNIVKINTYHIRVYRDKVHIYNKNNITQPPDLCFTIDASCVFDSIYAKKTPKDKKKDIGGSKELKYDNLPHPKSPLDDGESKNPPKMKGRKRKKERPDEDEGGAGEA